MKPVSILTDSSLRFHIEDALEAVSANPRNPKATQYLEEVHACERELLRRQTIRSYRAQASTVTDRLSCPLRYRRGFNVPQWKKQWARDAAFSLAFLKVCKN